MSKKNQQPIYAPSTSERTFIITLRWAVTLLCGAVLTGVVGGAFTAMGIVNTDHFVTTTNAKAIEELQEGKAEKSYVDKGFEGIGKTLQRIEGNQSEMQKDIKELIRR